MGVPALAGSPAEVGAACEVVLLSVVDAVQAEEVLVGPDGVLGAAAPGLVVVLMSTVSFESVQRLAALCTQHGATLLDAGVTGGSRAGENGLVVMVGGSEIEVAVAMPVLEAFAKTVVHCGGPGTGMVAKLARNAITYGQWALIREAAALAEAGDLPLDRLLEVLVAGNDEGTDRLSLLRGYVAGQAVPPEMVAYADHLAQKDLDAAQEFAASVDLQTPLVDVVKPTMAAVFAGRLAAPLPTDAHARGLDMMDRVYGPGYHRQVPDTADVPAIEHTVDQLFADVWSRPHLTTRDRRLFTLGITAMLGRPDLVETQLRGALANGELTVRQLRELALHGHYYAGWCNGTVLLGVVEKLVAELEAAHV